MQPSVLPPLVPAEPHPRRSFTQILLDPRSIQWLLATGGGLLVAGVVIWLASLGVFDNPLVVAGALGAGTLLMLGGGWWVVSRTSLQLAGKAVTLLACLVMPLNLWFYHSNHLMSLDGNLWMAAVICCALYAASALVLRDPLFVHVLMAGVAGTGLLMLADLDKVAEIASPSLMLVAMGLIGIHVERAFAPGDSPFSRQRFGMAFFASGHALLAGGLLLLATGQFTGWFVEPLLPSFRIATPAIVVEPGLKLLAIGIVLAGTYAYVYSDLVVRRVGVYVFAACGTLIWAEMLGLEMLTIDHKPEIVLGSLAATALVPLVLSRVFGARPHLHRTATFCGNGMMSLAFIGSTLMVLSRLLSDHARWSNAGLLGAMLVLTLIASALTQYAAWRRTYVFMAIVNAAMALITLGALSGLSGWQKFEVFVVAAGLAMLLSGHIGWYREQDLPSSGVSSRLAMGSLLAGVPPLVAAVVNRFGYEISLPDELALVTISALMLISGLLLQLRSTTLTGGTLLALHLAMLLTSAGMKTQLAVGVYVAIGGGAIFLLGLGLAIFRESLIQLPERVQRREGVFRVLSWR